MHLPAVLCAGCLLALAVTGCATSPSSVELTDCAPFRLREAIEPALTPTERRMVCGDPQNRNAENEGWQRISVAQAKVHLDAFLQSRGYGKPSYEEHGKQVWVHPGKKTFVTRARSEGAPEWLDLDRKRDIIGQTLTPQLLTTLEEWVYQELQANGYPCPSVSSRADPSTGEVVVQIDSGPASTIERLIEPDAKEIRPQALERYRAFRVGDPFNARLFSVTRSRIVLNRIIEDTRFTPLCGKSAGVVQQEVVVGPPREYSLGFSLDTETWGMLRASWRHTRLGSYSSIFLLDASVSAKIQRINSSFEGYFLPEHPRFRISPRLEVEHENETPYRNFSERAGVFAGRTWDWSDAGGVLDLGPEIELVQAREGPGVNSRFISVKTRLFLSSHEYEFFQFSPRTGYSLQFEASLNDRSLGSSSSARRLELLGERLWNIASKEPPLLILGTRFRAATTWTSERGEQGFHVPGRYLQYLGGTATLRGFGRKELPISGVGGLSALSFSFELRAPWKNHPAVQPVAFIDFGFTGEAPFQIDNPIYYSPGVGLRWQTPLGALNTSLARGYSAGGVATARAPAHWQFYLTLGEVL